MVTLNLIISTIQTCRSLLLVFKYGHRTMLILQWAFLSFEFGGLVFKRVNDEATTGCAHNGHRIVDIRTVTAFRQVNTHYWLR